jgi:hypothetical protein
MGDFLDKDKLVIPLAIFAITMFLAISVQQGDGAYYTADILSVQSGRWTGSVHPLWEFGHLMLRPAGLVVGNIIQTAVPSSWQWTPYMQVYGGLIALSTIASAVLTVVLFRLGRLLQTPTKSLIALTVGFCWAGSFLSCAKGAHPYIMSLLWIGLGLYLQTASAVRGDRQLSGKRFAAIAGCIALVGLWWFPMVLAAPAVAAVPVIIQSRSRWSEAFKLLVVAGVAVASLEVAGSWLAGNRSLADFAAWVADTNQHRQTKLWMRAISGFPKLLLHPGDSNILIKRYLLHDSYNPVSLVELAWKAGVPLMAFYVFSLLVAMAAWIHKPARPWLALLSISLGPMLLFSVTLFEPSSPERFLCVLPFLFATIAVAVQGTRLSAFASAGMAAFLVAMIGINAFQMVPEIAQREQRLQAKLREYRALAKPGDLVLIAVSEPLIDVAETRPFDPLRRGSEIAVHQLLLPNSVQIERWRFYFARRVLETWNQGRDAWFLKDTLASQPEPGSSWVEGDDPRLSWAELQKFLHGFALDATRGEYVLLLRTLENERRLRELLREGA